MHIRKCLLFAACTHIWIFSSCQNATDGHTIPRILYIELHLNKLAINCCHLNKHACLNTYTWHIHLFSLLAPQQVWLGNCKQVKIFKDLHSEIQFQNLRMTYKIWTLKLLNPWCVYIFLSAEWFLCTLASQTYNINATFQWVYIK